MNNCSDKLLGTYRFGESKFVSFSPLSVVHYLAQFFFFSVLFKAIWAAKGCIPRIWYRLRPSGFMFPGRGDGPIFHSSYFVALYSFCQAGRPCIWQCIFELVGCKRNKCYKGFCVLPDLICEICRLHQLLRYIWI